MAIDWINNLHLWLRIVVVRLTANETFMRRQLNNSCFLKSSTVKPLLTSFRHAASFTSTLYIMQIDITRGFYKTAFIYICIRAREGNGHICIACIPFCFIPNSSNPFINRILVTPNPHRTGIPAKSTNLKCNKDWLQSPFILQALH